MHSRLCTSFHGCAHSDLVALQPLKRLSSVTKQQTLCVPAASEVPGKAPKLQPAIQKALSTAKRVVCRRSCTVLELKLSLTSFIKLLLALSSFIADMQVV